MATVQVTDLCVVTAYVTDLDRSKAFYAKHFGFKEGNAMPPGVIMRAGNVALYLEGGRYRRESDASQETALGFTFSLREGLKEAYQKLQQTDVDMVGTFQECSPSFAFFQIADPDGNIIELAGKP